MKNKWLFAGLLGISQTITCNPMKKITLSLLLTLLFLTAVSFLLRPAIGGLLTQPRTLPEFTGQAADWINSAPLPVSDLHGKVVLLDFWTFDCWICYRSFPWLAEIEKRYHAQGLQVIGIHTPEFAHEKIRENVVAKAQEFDLHHPVMMDNNFAYWKAMANRYWPTFYLVDKKGNIRASYIGETHKGDTNAQQIEQQIKLLLAE